MNLNKKASNPQNCLCKNKQESQSHGRTDYSNLLPYLIQLKGLTDCHNVKVSTAEVMTCFVIAMRFFYGNLDLAINEIMAAKKPIPDPGGLAGDLRWDVPGTFR